MKRQRTPIKTTRSRGRIVRALAMQGFSGDVIAATLGLNKNHLRAAHALDLAAGREIKLADKAPTSTRKERERLEAIASSFRSCWYTPEHGNDLFNQTHSVEEALAWCKEKFGWE